MPRAKSGQKTSSVPESKLGKLLAADRKKSRKRSKTCLGVTRDAEGKLVPASPWSNPPLLRYVGAISRKEIKWPPSPSELDSEVVPEQTVVERVYRVGWVSLARSPAELRQARKEKARLAKLAVEASAATAPTSLDVANLTPDTQAAPTK